jgi:zinc/manganese transport system ATP-binding protein
LTALSFEDVTLALGGVTILAGVNLAIGAGELVGVLGPNGSGKTTLLRAALGLLKPSAGRITLFSQPARPGNPGVGYLPQVRHAPPEVRLTGRTFLASAVNGNRLGLPLPGREGWAEIDRAIETVGAKALADRPLRDLSGGERQRLLIAQALIGEPKILLLDEPLISLDPRQQQATVELVRRLSRELKLTVLFTAHELNQLIGAIDRVLYLGGKAAAIGTVDEVVTSPVLSRLYGAPIEVVKVAGRIFVMSGGLDMERDHHRHDHGDEGDGHSHHGHSHGHDDHVRV